jgi:hypothetical protein
MFEEWLNIQGNVKTNLIFRASQHRWRASDFHKYCDNKGANIVIIKNEFGYIFGGYISISWESSGG